MSGCALDGHTFPRHSPWSVELRELAVRPAPIPSASPATPMPPATYARTGTWEEVGGDADGRTSCGERSSRDGGPFASSPARAAAACIGEGTEAKTTVSL